MEMIIALNNKSNLEKEEFKDYLLGLETISTTETLILCPTFLNLALSSQSHLIIGSQNVSKNENGAFTGEISASQLKSYQVKYTIVGHSERREYQKETNEEINLKIKQLLKNDITPILCIGESLEQRKENKVKEVLKEELTIALQDLTPEEKKKIIIAYEPIWSIGTGIIPTNEQIEEVFEEIKKSVPESKILYGGSANEENIDQLKKIKMIDGYLLGGLSLKIEKLKIFLQKLH